MKANTLRTTLAALSIGLSGYAAWADPANYPEPAQAVDAFVAALQARDHAALLVVMGRESEDLMSSGDTERDDAACSDFLTGHANFHGLNDLAEGKKELVIGRVLWSFPVPLVKGDGGWHFDPAAAREEILDRRIGRNELDVIDILNRVAGVQAAFRAVDHDGDGVMEYASSILSSPGQRDGCTGRTRMGPRTARLATRSPGRRQMASPSTVWIRNRSPIWAITTAS